MLVNRRANRQEVSGNNLSHRPLRSGAGTIASELASPTNESNPEESELGSVNERLASGEKPDPDSIVQVLGNDSDPIESEADWDGELVASEDEKQPGSLYTPVELHPREQDIYQGADGNGGFKFAANLTHRNAKYQRIIDKDYPLKERYLAALMLTEACSDIRRGKVCNILGYYSMQLLIERPQVYYVPMKIELGINSPRISNEDRATATRIYHRVPKLVYEPCEWGDEDVQTWKDMNHGGMLLYRVQGALWMLCADETTCTI